MPPSTAADAASLGAALALAHVALSAKQALVRRRQAAKSACRSLFGSRDSTEAAGIRGVIDRNLCRKGPPDLPGGGR